MTDKREPTDCIYPGPHGAMSAEHYLSEGLGSFAGCEPLTGRVCRPCNTRIGDQTELQFLRSGQVGFFRWLLGIEGKDGFPPSPFRRGAAGAPPLVMLGTLPDFPFPLLLEVKAGTEDVLPLRQIVFDGGLAGVHPVAITDRMRDDIELLRDYLIERGLNVARPVHMFAAEADLPWMTALMRTLGGQPAEPAVTTNPAPRRIQVVTLIQVTDPHFRAVAKTVFHYALKMFPDLCGKEREFDAIKRFIWDGGDVGRFVQQRLPEDVVTNLRRGAGWSHWMHILMVERTYQRIIGWFQPFAGPRTLAPLYAVDIGMDPARIVARREQRAHQFVILDPRRERGPIGVMEDMQPANYIRPV